MAAVIMVSFSRGKRRLKTLMLADPHIFFHEGLYYLYGTASHQGFEVYASRDLKNWRGPVGAKNGFALKKGDAPA
jgi:xylan 1,4-beta-xylosidase